MPESLQRAMAVEQEARREAMAKVAAANGERDAVVALKEAADIMESNPIALQVLLQLFINDSMLLKLSITFTAALSANSHHHLQQSDRSHCLSPAH